MKILIVDDAPDDRAIVRRELAALEPDAGIVEAGTRAALEAALAGGPFDLVVTDLALKWGDGREVLDRSRALFPDAPVIMFTDSGDETTAVELLKAGLDDYVVKSPRQLPRLRASLGIALETGRRRTALTLRERELADALAAQRVLVRELNHRVRNNLQIVLSLLRLREREEAGRTAEALADLAERVTALAQVQARIIDADQPSRVDFSRALSDIAGELVAAHGAGRVRLDLDASPSLILEMWRAMPLALVVHEVLSAAVRRGFEEAGGVLAVRVRSEPDVRLSVCAARAFDPAEGGPAEVRMIRALSREAKAALELHDACVDLVLG